MAAQLQALKSQRNAKITNIKKEWKKGDEAFAKKEFEAVEKSLDKLEIKRADLRELNSKIIPLTDPAQQDAESLSVEDFDDKLIEHQDEYRRFLKNLTQQKAAQGVAQMAVDSSATSSAAAANAQPQNVHVTHVSDQPTVKLPNLELEKFSGEATEWAEFWDGYKSTIHENEKLKKVEKLKYLKHFMSGEAQRLLKGYQLTEINYDTAIDALQSRFGDTEAAISAHLKALRNMPPAKFHTASLWETYDNCEMHICSLLALKYPEDVLSRGYMHDILEKFPKFIRAGVKQNLGSQALDLKTLRKILREQIEVRAFVDETETSTKPQVEKPESKGSWGSRKNWDNHNKFNGSTKPNGGPKGKETSLVSSVARGGRYQNNQGKKPNCSYCSQEHYSDACTKYPNIKGRKDRLGERCHKCLSGKHGSDGCPYSRPCVHCKKEGHHRSLCPEQFGRNQGKEGESYVAFSSNLRATANEFVPNDLQLKPPVPGHALLQTAMAHVFGKNGNKVQARFLFDVGSTKSYVVEKIRKQMDAMLVGSETIYIAGFGDTKRKTKTYDKVAFAVQTTDGHQIQIEACATEVISCPIRKVPFDPTRFPLLNQIQLAEPLVTAPEQVEIDILLGCDYYYDFVGLARLQGADGLILLESKLGFIATGRVQDQQNPQATTLLYIDQCVQPSTEVDVSRFWGLEDIGIKDNATQVDDEEAMRQFLDTVQFTGKRYAVTWPWKHPKACLPSNCKSAFAQLQSNLKTLQKHPNVLQQYDKTIRDQETKEIIERVPEGVVRDGEGIHYLKHHCVLKPDRETTKIRVVDNAAAKPRGAPYSLNECLYRGMVILENLGGILMRFRLFPIAVMSDIEKAFLQVQLQEHERDVTRFVWVNDVSKPPIGKNVVHYRFQRVNFGVNSSPFLLAETIQYHLSHIGTEVALDMAKNTYVDNIIGGKNSPAETIAYYQEAKQIFQKCSMNLHLWYTNDPQVQDAFSENDKGKRTDTKVMGLCWNTQNDCLSCPKITTSTDQITKRQCSSTLGKLYDPCGYFAPVTVTGKILIQQIWESQVDWDDPLSEQIVRQWLAFVGNLSQIPATPLKRWLGMPLQRTKFQIHTFCDASKSAYAAAVYLRCQQGENVIVNLVFSKTRVCPLKKLTIPRLELLAVLIGVRLTNYVTKELRLEIEKKSVWTDSLCVLQWIPKKLPMATFIENRLSEIRKPGDIEFCHIRSEQNPADVASRGCEHQYLIQNSLWWHAPSFLQQPESTWPSERFIANECSKQSKEKDPCIDHCEVFLVTNQDIETSVNVGIGNLIDPKKYSDLQSLLRVTVWVKRAFQSRTFPKFLTSDEIAAATTQWILDRQKRAFPEIPDGKGNGRSQVAKQLKVFLDDIGQVRCQGRLIHSQLPYESNCPILLPRKDPFTELIINDIHRRLGHAGVSHVLAQVRRKYWIPQGRSTVKRVLKECRQCRRYNATAFQIPNQPPLPPFRVERCEPFQRVGVDYLGPLYVKKPGGKNCPYVWVCLFTCAVTRGIHLEVVPMLDAEQFLLCLRRFVARFGRPEQIISDNATNFHLAERAIHTWWGELLEDENVQNWAAENQISWKFVTETAPWMGGFYESMIGRVKHCLVRTLGRKKLNIVQMQTIMAEIESMVNTRPLTALEEEVDEPFITPAHFLAPRMKEIIPTPKFANAEYKSRDEPNKEKLILTWRRTQANLDQFWKIWQHQYLLSLREKWAEQKQRNPNCAAPKVGMVVLIQDNNQQRGQWRMGKIEKLHTSFDGEIRSVTLKTQAGEVNRPIKLLVPLEFDVGASNVSLVEKVPQEPQPQAGQRPTRRTAAVARENVRKNLATFAEGSQ